MRIPRSETRLARLEKSTEQREEKVLSGETLHKWVAKHANRLPWAKLIFAGPRKKEGNDKSYTSTLKTIS